MDFDIIRKSDYIPWKKLIGKRIFITGANGLLGKNLIKYISEYSKLNQLNIKLVAYVRNYYKTVEIFEDFKIDVNDVEIIKGEISGHIVYDNNIDYIIHVAAPTSSRFFKEKPVETIEAIAEGTKHVIEFAKTKDISGMVFLSTMEVFGRPQKGEVVDEDYKGGFDVRDPRNSYPLGKIMAENLCCSYAYEYGLPIKILRLTQTFGPGVEKNDSRVFAEFARCANERKNIILKTKGETERCYLYTVDAVTAILTVLLKGAVQEIYVAANDRTFCSIYDMAKLVANKYKINVVIEEEDVRDQGFADVLHMNLSVERLKKLGWKPIVDLDDMFMRMIESF